MIKSSEILVSHPCENFHKGGVLVDGVLVNGVLVPSLIRRVGCSRA
jgi:hypothetical protein